MFGQIKVRPISVSLEMGTPALTKTDAVSEQPETLSLTLTNILVFCKSPVDIGLDIDELLRFVAGVQL